MDNLADKAAEMTEALHKRWSSLHANQAAKCRLQGIGIAVGAVVGFVVARKVWHSLTGYEEPVSHTHRLAGLRHLSVVPSKHVTHAGSCGCGSVRFTVHAAQTLDVLVCHIKSRKGTFQNVIVPASQFSLQTSQAALSMSVDSSSGARFLFCADCGVQVFHFSAASTEFAAINARCFDDVSLRSCRVHIFSGTHWPHAFATVQPSALVVDAGNPPSSRGRRHGQDRSDVGASQSGQLSRRSRKHGGGGARLRANPMTAVGWVAGNAYVTSQDGAGAIHTVLRESPAESTWEQDRLHALYNLPRRVNYSDVAPLATRSVEAVSREARTPRHGEHERKGSEDDVRGMRNVPSAPRSAIMSNPTTPFTTTSAVTPYSPVPEVNRRVMATRAARSESYRSRQLFEAAPDAEMEEPDANPGMSRPRGSNSSFNSVTSTASTHSTLRTQRESKILRKAAESKLVGAQSRRGANGNSSWIHRDTLQNMRRHLLEA